jgi:hypothetical protein
MKWMCHSIHSHVVSLIQVLSTITLNFIFQKTDANAERERLNLHIHRKILFSFELFLLFFKFFTHPHWQQN